MDGFKGIKAILERSDIGNFPGAKIESGVGMIGDDVDARAARNDVGVDGNAAGMVVPLFDASDLRGQLVNRVHALFRCKASVGCAAVHGGVGLRQRLCGKS